MRKKNNIVIVVDGECFFFSRTGKRYDLPWLNRETVPPKRGEVGMKYYYQRIKRHTYGIKNYNVNEGIYL